MALTDLQRTLCRLIADNRIASGESYVGGGVALNELIGAPRLSRDVDLFHDTEEALAATWQADRLLFERSGYSVRVLRERPSFVEAEVSRAGDVCLLQWVRDSAYRFFPLVRHDDFGLTLHPFDLATNKVLALVGRVEVRDWVDVLECDARLQPLGYLAWAACGKDPGFNPASILEHAAATTRYSAVEVAELAFEGSMPPDAAALSRRWHEALSAARELVARLPADQIGRCVLTPSGVLCQAAPPDLPALLVAGDLRFHEGRIRGALPVLR
jgi:hypothetical protein